MLLEVTKLITTKLVFAAMLCATLTACDKSRIYEVNNVLKDEKWSYENAQEFETEISDTALRYNIYVNIRHSYHFEWRNVWVSIKTTLPDGKKLSKRVNLQLCEADGEWFGECGSDNCFIQIPIQENAIFPQTGVYKFSIAQDMRINPLKNIRTVGLRIEKHQTM